MAGVQSNTARTCVRCGAERGTGYKLCDQCAPWKQPRGPIQRSCIRCGAAFTLQRIGSGGGNRRHCSDRCRRLAANTAVCACGAPQLRRSGSCLDCHRRAGAASRLAALTCSCGGRKNRYASHCRSCANALRRAPERVCFGCHVTYTPKERTRFGFHSRECYQDWCRRERERKGAERAALPKPYERIRRECEACGKTFQGTPRARFCPQRKCVSDRSWAARKAKQATFSVAFTCAECGSLCERIVRPADGCSVRAVYRFCSGTNCAKRFWRRRRKRQLRARRRALFHRVFERDRWICQLCKKPVKRRVPTNHDLAATADHIHATALGGTDDEWNLQCAHRICNARKNAKILGQLRLHL